MQTGRNLPIKELIKDRTGKTNIRKAGHSTVMWDEGSEDGDIGVTCLMYHKTIIVKKYQDKYVLNSGGYRTQTTKLRITEYLEGEWYIHQANGHWRVSTPLESGIFFYDGIVFSIEGKLLSENKEPNVAKEMRIRKAIKSYCDHIKKLDKLPQPSSGDCWYCCMVTEGENKQLVDATKNNDHIEAHVKDHYIHGSLILNALKEGGYNKEQMATAFHFCRHNVVRAVRSYIIKRLLPDVACR